MDRGIFRLRLFSIAQLRSGIGNIDLLAEQESHDISLTVTKEHKQLGASSWKFERSISKLKPGSSRFCHLANDQYFPHVIPSQEELERSIVTKQVLDVAIVEDTLQTKLWTALQT